ncbi:MAG TPA: hypothetical protein PLB38_01390 [bacterium]|nr:hypothetical protein [bacterium]
MPTPSPEADEDLLPLDLFGRLDKYQESSVQDELRADYDLDADAAARVSDLMDEYDLDADSAIAMDDADNDDSD